MEKYQSSLVTKIKEIFVTKDYKLKNKLEELSKQLLEQIIQMKEKNNIYTDININIVENILSIFGVEDNIDFYSLKNAFFKKGFTCTACSNILSDYRPNINSKVAELISENKRFILTGITNCDEFCCGSDGSTSSYGNVIMDDNLPVGGSSSGAAASLYFGHTLFAMGTDTGGSVRWPANSISAYGIKPTYGSISGDGIITYAASLDVVGLLTNQIDRIEEVLKILYVYDPRDSRMIINPYYTYEYNATIKVIVLDYNNMEQSQKNFIKKVMKDSRFKVNILPLKINHKLISIVYSGLSSMEICSELAKYDPIKHGSITKAPDLRTIYEKRFESFGENIRGKILQGALFLFDNSLRKMYLRILEQRCSILYSFHNIFQDNNTIIITPHINKNYSNDEETYNKISNISGTPSISIPMLSYNKYVARNKYLSLLLHGLMKSDNLLIYFAKATQQYA